MGISARKGWDMLPRPCRASTIPGSLSGFIGKSVFVIAFLFTCPHHTTSPPPCQGFLITLWDGSYTVVPWPTRYRFCGKNRFLVRLWVGVIRLCLGPPGDVFAEKTGFWLGLGWGRYDCDLTRPVTFSRKKPVSGQALGWGRYDYALVCPVTFLRKTGFWSGFGVGHF